MSIMHDVMYPPERRDIQKRQVYKKATFDHEVGEMFYCEQCDRCWQKPVTRNLDHKNFVDYLQDFPTIGKERKVCNECKNLRVICDLCDRDVPKEVGDITGAKAVMVPNITKRNGIWICNPCDKKYPEEDNNDK